MEIWKDIKGYEKMYQVSNLGNVKSLKFNKERILKGGKDKAGYNFVNLCANGIENPSAVHRLVAIAFLGHKSGGYEIVVDHINHDKTDNRTENLRLVTQRENCSHKKKKSSSIYTGVHLRNDSKKWQAQISIKGKIKYLGAFDCELEASEAYQTALNNLNK